MNFFLLKIIIKVSQNAFNFNQLEFRYTLYFSMIPYFEKNTMQCSAGNKRQCNGLGRKRTAFHNGKLKV